MLRKLPVIVALDEPWQKCRIWTERLDGMIWGFKIGSILFAEKGPELVAKLKKQKFKIFLDLKYHDIPNTVSGAVQEAFALGVDLLTVHACGGREMLKSAAQHQTKKQSVLAVTVLTSLDQRDLVDLGINRTPPQQVAAMAKLSVDAGIKGLVCSVQEVRALREQFPNSILVTPGIRVSEAQDQKRTGSLSQTLKDGASLAVLGRALTESKNWKKTWDELNSTLDGMSLPKL